MADYAQFVKQKLMSIIADMTRTKEYFATDPRKDFTRQRKLPFDEMIRIILSMGGGSLNHKLEEYFRYDSAAASSSAFVQQRDKIRPKAFEFLLYKFTNSFDSYSTYNDYRLVAADGSDLHLPHDPSNNQTYFQSLPDSKGFNLLHLNVIYDLCNRIYLDARVQNGRAQNEFRALTDMVDASELDGTVIIVADRGYESYNVFAHIAKKGWKYLIRVKDVSSNGILSSFDLPKEEEFDQQIQRVLTCKQTREIKAQPHIYRFIPNNSTFDYLDIDSKEKLYYPMAFRAVRIKTAENAYQCFITNLDPEEFGTEGIREIYRMRWGVETSFRELKHTLGLTNLHSKKMACIIQEIFARMVIYNFCEIITLHIVIQQKSRKHGCQVNFSMAMNICRQFFKSLKNAHPPDVEALIQKHLLPIRKGRTNPRKVKFRTFVSFNYRLA